MEVAMLSWFYGEKRKKQYIGQWGWRAPHNFESIDNFDGSNIAVQMKFLSVTVTLEIVFETPLFAITSFSHFSS